MIYWNFFFLFGVESFKISIALEIVITDEIIDKDRSGIYKITNNIMTDFKLFLVTYAKAFFIITTPPY